MKYLDIYNIINRKLVSILLLLINIFIKLLQNSFIDLFTIQLQLRVYIYSIIKNNFAKLIVYTQYA